MDRRLDLQAVLEAITPNVYFQPPDTAQMLFPCIVYRIYGKLASHADNLPYMQTTRYQVTVIDRNPDSEIVDKVFDLPMCIYNRYFPANGLHHNVYNLYY